jgi:hypothetical protein
MMKSIILYAPWGFTLGLSTFVYILFKDGLSLCDRLSQGYDCTHDCYFTVELLLQRFLCNFIDVFLSRGEI